MARLELSSRAKRDLRRVDADPRRRLAAVLEQLVSDPPPPNLDTKALAGHAPWRRLRVGTYRVIHRRMEDGGLLIERIVHRRDLERAVDSLR